VGLGFFTIHLLVFFCGQDFVGPSKLRCHPLIDSDASFYYLIFGSCAQKPHFYCFKVGLSDGGETHPEHSCHRPQHDQVAGKLSGRNADIFAEG
jgi:hypothetical protein